MDMTYQVTVIFADIRR